MSNLRWFSILFLGLFVFRLGFGLSQTFYSPDELQTYLIGLRTYTDHIWPYFGPDLIVTETGFYSQIPGALEGLLVGLPFYIFPIPEAPFLLLNLLSLGGLALFSLYISKHMRHVSFFFILAWLAVLPWNLHESANIINPSYLLFGSCVFFLGFFESIPETARGWLSPAAAFGCMGFGIFWDMQFHFSFVLLPAFPLGALAWRLRNGKFDWARPLAGFIGGSLFPLAFLVPTYLKFGFIHSGGGLNLSVGFNRDNFKQFFVVLARFLSLPSYELPRFLGPGTHERLAFFKAAPWLILPGVFLLIVGWLQPLVLLFMGFTRDKVHSKGRLLAVVTGFSLLMVWASFWFTSKPPLAHIYYVLFPLTAIYSFYIWDRLAEKKYWRTFGKICLAASFLFELGYMVKMMPLTSLYPKRPLVQRAISEKNYHLLGERRDGSVN